MITRRSFLIGSVGLLTYSLLDKYLNYFEQHGEPLIEAPKTADKLLNLNTDDNWLQLGSMSDYAPDPYPKPPTWHEFVTNSYEIDSSNPSGNYWDNVKHSLFKDPFNPNIEELKDFADYFRVSPEDYWKPMEKGMWEDIFNEEYYHYKNTPWSEAYHYLDGLDLGKSCDLESPFNYGLSLMDTCGVHGDTCAAEIRNPVSLSLLQMKLIELGESTKLVI